MMQLVGILYFIFLLTMVVAALFVVFHFYRYTVDRTMAKFFMVLFSIVFIVLLSWNVSLFFSISWNDFSPDVFMPETNNSFSPF